MSVEKSSDGPASAVVERLFSVIESRKTADPESSYTARLFAAGDASILRKFGEEAIETLVAAASEDSQAVAAESADLLYHLLVLWAAKGVRPEDVWRVLAAREGTSGLEEKASRKKK